MIDRERGKKEPLKTCAACGDDLPREAFGKYDSYHVRAKCKKCEEDAKGKTKTCKRCEKDLPMDAFEKKKGRRERYEVCSTCQHPLCSKCGTKRKSIWSPSPKAKDPARLCDKCEKKEQRKKKKTAGLKKT